MNAGLMLCMITVDVFHDLQVYAYTASGLTDHKNSRYTQFVGFLMRPSVDSMHEVVRRLGNTDLEAAAAVDDCNR